MNRDDLRDALALIGAALTDDDEGQDVIRDNASTEGLIDTLLLACVMSVRIMADQDGTSPQGIITKLQRILRTI